MQTSNPCLLNDTFKAQLFNVASTHTYTAVSVVFFISFTVDHWMICVVLVLILLDN